MSFVICMPNMKGECRTMTRDEKIFKLCKEITDRATVMLGVDKIDTNAPEYWGVDAAMQIAEKKFGMSAAADALDVALVLKSASPSPSRSSRSAARWRPRGSRRRWRSCATPA